MRKGGEQASIIGKKDSSVGPEFFILDGRREKRKALSLSQLFAASRGKEGRYHRTLSALF